MDQSGADQNRNHLNGPIAGPDELKPIECVPDAHHPENHCIPMRSIPLRSIAIPTFPEDSWSILRGF